MKRILPLLILLFSCQRLYGQDSIQVSFHQEPDTLRKQLFIDRYENVFMTKVPTKHMVRVAALSGGIHGIGINAGYEYKVLPFLSLEASIYTQLSRNYPNRGRMLIFFDRKRINVFGSVKARWYYNMNRRIKNGLNANNFSGAYFGISYEKSLHLSRWSLQRNVSKAALLWGFQSRFFNNGYMDFSVGVYEKGDRNYAGFQDYENSFDVRNFVLGTQTNIGLAIGDWKKNKTSPICDVVICDEQIKKQLKIEIPTIAVGLVSQYAKLGAAFEQKLGTMPVSVQGHVNFSLYNLKGPDFLRVNFSSAGTGLEFRYYFLQKWNIRHGRGGNNLSGVYAAAKGSYDITSIKEKYPFSPPESGLNSLAKDLSVGAAMGYQQRLFGRIFVDGSVCYQKTFPGAYRIPMISRPLILPKITVGFTL